MKNYDSRIKRLEQVLSPERYIILVIDRSLTKPSSNITINGRSEPFPPTGKLEEFIKYKLMLIKGDIKCDINIAASDEPMPDFSGLLKIDDIQIIIEDINNSNFK